MAQKLEDFERDKDLYPNLKFHTAGDARVREAHKVYDGLVLPINHPFWKNRIPPLDWGCRCNLTQTDEDVSERIPKTPKEPIANNPVLTGKVFNENAYEQGLGSFDNKQAKANLNEFLTSEGEWQSTPNKRVKISRLADQKDLQRNYEVADICARELNIDFAIREHIDAQRIKNPEYLINGQYFGDRKSIESLNNFDNNIKDAKKQMMDKTINPDQTPHYIVWDFDKIKDLNVNQVIKDVLRNVTETRGRTIKGMIFQYNGKAAHLTREQILTRSIEILQNLK